MAMIQDFRIISQSLVQTVHCSVLTIVAYLIINVTHHAHVIVQDSQIRLFHMMNFSEKIVQQGKPFYLSFPVLVKI